MADPTSAALEGIAPDYQSSIYADFVTFGGRGERQAQNDLAAWLRAVAKRMIDETIWNYRIYEAMGGKAYLALLAFNGSDDLFGGGCEAPQGLFRMAAGWFGFCSCGGMKQRRGCLGGPVIGEPVINGSISC